jgi:hypothetical protein
MMHQGLDFPRLTKPSLQCPYCPRKLVDNAALYQHLKFRHGVHAALIDVRDIKRTIKRRKHT